LRILVDTNLLARAAKPGDPLHTTAAAVMTRLERDGHDLCVVPQNLYEFWAIATRPTDSGGLGLSVDETKLEVARLRGTFILLPDGPDLLQSWLDLVVAHACLGKPSHDARLVAAMKVHGVTALLTFNATDFKRFSDITIIDPRS
jgi:predicted nucleic acid-binding protein